MKNYKLEFNSKTKIYSKNEGFHFLGFRFIIKDKIIVKVKNQTKRRIKKRMNRIYRLYKKSVISYEQYYSIYSSYKGHLNKAKCNKLIKEYSPNKIFDIGQFVRIEDL